MQLLDKLLLQLRYSRWLYAPREVARFLRKNAKPTSSRDARHDIVDRLSSILIEDPVVRIPSFESSFQLSAKSDLFKRIIMDGEYETETLRTFLQHLQPDRDVIDIGANVGFFTCAAAKKLFQGRLLSIEPTPGAFARLKRNVDRNAVEGRVILFNGAVSDREGEIQMAIIEDMEEYSSIGSIDHPAVANNSKSLVSVTTKTLDYLVVEHSLKPSLIKIDVEGAEQMVINSGLKTLRDFRPVIVLELADILLRRKGTSISEVIALLGSLDYKVVDTTAPNMTPGYRGHGDFVAIPVEVYTP